jgi:hypothetical protein
MLGLWCLTPLSTIFQLYRVVVKFYREEKGVPGEIHQPDPLQVTNKLENGVSYVEQLGNLHSILFIYKHSK